MDTKKPAEKQDRGYIRTKTEDCSYNIFGHRINPDTVKPNEGVVVLVDSIALYDGVGPERKFLQYLKETKYKAFSKISENDYWYGIVANVKRHINVNGWEFDCAKDELVYIEKKLAAERSEVVISEEDLYWRNELSDTVSQKAKDFIELKLISKEEFDAAIPYLADSLIADTQNIRKKGLLISLPTEKKIVRLKDKPVDFTEYYYRGYFPRLNCYLIGVNYDAYSSDFLVNKQTGEIFDDMYWEPIIRPDGKVVVSYAMMPESQGVWLGAYAVKNQKISPLFEIWFKTWTVAGQYFWDKDNFLYIPIRPYIIPLDIHQKWKVQYIKARILK